MAQIFASERSRSRRSPVRSAARSVADPALSALQDRADRSPANRRLAQLQAGAAPVQRVEEEEPLQGKAGPGGLGAETVQRMEEEEPLQGKAVQGGLGTETAQRAAMDEEEPLQGKAAGPQGLPTGLRQGIERLSGVDAGAVRVHYNSDRPAQLNAHAYAQGSDIHLAPGQERHLPHEAWHTVQQAQGRVAASAELAGQPVNDDAGLEREADTMGARAQQQGKR